MSVNFEIYRDQNDYESAVSENTLMNLLRSDPVFKEELLRENHRGHYGKLEILFYKHSLVDAELYFAIYSIQGTISMQGS
jgi:hypothetical protein